MRCLIILVFFVAATGTSFSQKETTSRVDSARTRTVTLTKAQQDWLNHNYRELARLPKDNAAALVKKNFPSVNEATLEFYIMALGKLQLQRKDAQDSLEQLKQLRQQQQKESQQQAQEKSQLAKQTKLLQLLERLKAQKESLLALIAQKEAELAASVDPVIKELLRLLINSMRDTLAALNNGIKDAEEAIRRLQG